MKTFINKREFFQKTIDVWTANPSPLAASGVDMSEFKKKAYQIGVEGFMTIDDGVMAYFFNYYVPLRDEYLVIFLVDDKNQDWGVVTNYRMLLRDGRTNQVNLIPLNKLVRYHAPRGWSKFNVTCQLIDGRAITVGNIPLVPKDDIIAFLQRAADWQHLSYAEQYYIEELKVNIPADYLEELRPTAPVAKEILPPMAKAIPVSLPGQAPPFVQTSSPDVFAEARLLDSVTIYMPNFIGMGTSAEAVVEIENKGQDPLDSFYLDFSDMQNLFFVEGEVRAPALSPGVKLISRLRITPRSGVEGTIPVSVGIVGARARAKKDYIVKVGGTEIY